MFWIQWNSSRTFLAKWDKKTLSSFLQLTYTFPEHTPGLPSALLHHQGDLSLIPVAGLLCGNLYFSLFCSKYCHNKFFSAPVRVPSLQPASSTAPISVVRILCRCYLFQMYIKAIQPCNGLCSVMCCCHLSLLVSPVCFPLWRVPIKLQALWGKRLPFLCILRHWLFFLSLNIFVLCL